MAIYLSHGGTSIYHSESPSNELAVGTVAGIFTIRKDKSNEWNVSSKMLEGLHIHTLVMEPSSGLLFAGAHKGSLYVSSDMGQTWEHRDTGLTKKDVYCLSFVQVDGRVKLYVGTEPAHLFERTRLAPRWLRR